MIFRCDTPIFFLILPLQYKKYWWFIVNQVLVIVNWQEKLCTAVTKVSQTSQGVVDDVFPQQKKNNHFAKKKSILFKMLIFGLKMKWDGVILPALISMKLA